MAADLLIPGVLALTACASLYRRENVYAAMTDGAAGGLKLLLTIVPSLIVLLTAIHMLRASGVLDLIAEFLAPVLGRIGLPPETLPLMLVRPFSGSAALAVGADLKVVFVQVFDDIYITAVLLDNERLSLKVLRCDDLSLLWHVSLRNYSHKVILHKRNEWKSV